MGKGDLIMLDIIQFYEVEQISPDRISSMAREYKVNNSEELKVDIYKYLLPHMKNMLLRRGFAYCELEDGLSISWDIVEYLLGNWTVMGNFYGYFSTYYTKLFFTKWNYSKEYNGNLIKRSKVTDMKGNEEGRITIISNYQKDEEGDLFLLDCEDANESLRRFKREIVDVLHRNYSKKDRELLLYGGKVGELTKKQIEKLYGIPRRKFHNEVDRVMSMARNDKDLYELWLEGC